jgi:hypothetical protein
MQALDPAANSSSASWLPSSWGSIKSYGKGAAEARVHILDDLVVCMLDDIEMLPAEQFLIDAGEAEGSSKSARASKPPSKLRFGPPSNAEPAVESSRSQASQSSIPTTW